MYNMPRAATIKASTPGVLWSLVSFKPKKIFFLSFFYAYSRRLYNIIFLFKFLFQDRKTFRQIIVKANANKRKQFEEFLKSLPVLENISVS